MPTTEIGFSRPDVTYENMRHTNVLAGILNDDVRAYVRDETFRAAWSAWYAQWKAFFDKTLDEKFTNFVTMKTDAIAETAAQYRQDLARWQETYKAQRDAEGKPLPIHVPEVPVTPPPPDAKKEGISIWTLLAIAGGVGVAVAGYYFVKSKADEMKAKRAALDAVTEKLLTPMLGPMAEPVAKVSVAHDCPCERDVEVRAIPRPHLKYMLTGM